MNATEARKLAEKNADRLADRQLEEAITSMEKEIRENVELGFFGARIDVQPSEQWDKYNCTLRFENFFQTRGFVFECDLWGTSLVLICKW
ncbi:hypothetical protein [Bacillus norwichensis]|uniref:Uncharacterized protein n=1 Tax=Bacillus norwichensis TaxID=2762217 RepID=A0ABR8VM46_9BACI|nr:hypothetical protein [Bacillus norwichensis]MBD8005852.1 hypothetical protein [Bacillus norwichensis]